MKDQAYYEERVKIGKLNQAGIISICPVCHHGVAPTIDEPAKYINENWFHGPCARFASLVFATSSCPVCGDTNAVQEGDTVAGRWWMACSTCRLPVARWATFAVCDCLDFPNVHTIAAHA